MSTDNLIRTYIGIEAAFFLPQSPTEDQNLTGSFFPDTALYPSGCMHANLRTYVRTSTRGLSVGVRYVALCLSISLPAASRYKL